MPEDLFTLGFDGEILDGPKGTRPVSEFHIHSEIYKMRPDVNSVLHAHPMVPILFTIAEGASGLVPPSGRPQTARTCCSNWLVSWASKVW